MNSELCEISKIDIKPDDVIVLRMPINIYSFNDALSVFNCFKKSFPENTFLFLPSNCDLQVYSHQDIEFNDKDIIELWGECFKS